LLAAISVDIPHSLCACCTQQNLHTLGEAQRWRLGKSMTLPGAAFFLGAGAPALTVATAYANGAKRRASINCPVSLMRHLAFAAGLGLFFLSTQRPFADWAHEYFSVHQVGILIARILAPLLIVSAHPAGLLIAGSPRPLRRRILKPG
jgi:putative membrane protein